MELNETDVLREQARLLTQRIAELESQNTKHRAMLQVIAVNDAQKAEADAQKAKDEAAKKQQAKPAPKKKLARPAVKKKGKADE